MNWAEIRPGLKALIASVSGLTVVWIDEPRGYTDPITEALAVLSVTSVDGVGWDECHVIQDLTLPQGQELQDEWRGNRKFTLSIKVESEIQTDTGSAYQYLESIRDSLNFRSSAQALRDLDCAWYGSAPTQDLTAAQDQRNRSIAVIDLFMSARTTALDPIRYTYVETADFAGDLTDGQDPGP
jgi:hypothetical protein